MKTLKEFIKESLIDDLNNKKGHELGSFTQSIYGVNSIDWNRNKEQYNNDKAASIAIKLDDCIDKLQEELSRINKELNNNITPKTVFPFEYYFRPTDSDIDWELSLVVSQRMVNKVFGIKPKDLNIKLKRLFNSDLNSISYHNIPIDIDNFENFHNLLVEEFNLNSINIANVKKLLNEYKSLGKQFKNAIK